ncbi:amidophosphoribosyltransferase [Pelagibacteraceae bacterium]|nr:amidophosphoribosyltransferase [Pelagibacteraceae bacterium]
MKNRQNFLKKFELRQSHVPRFNEECGVFGISGTKDAAALTALGLHALQHRGQEGCGIVSYDGNSYHSERKFGLVGDNFTKKHSLDKLKGKIAIGHNRYSTTGGETIRNIQPFYADLHGGAISIAHNGNLTNALLLREQMVREGAIFQTTSDTETIVQLVARSKKKDILNKIIDALMQIQGGYALSIIANGTLIGARDPLGIRPLVLGKFKNAFILASETCALDIIGAKFIREIENGEVVVIKDNKVESRRPFPKKQIKPCVFEYIYFSRPDSILKNKTAYEYRKNLGTYLAKETDIKPDVVVPVPDSGVPAALGFSQESGIPFELGLIRNHYVGRTFIEPTQQIRSLGVKLKLNPNQSSIKKKKVVLIDDSLVRGTTSTKIIKMLYDFGAKEVHMRIASPAIKYPDFYGVDTPTQEELLAANKNLEEMCKYIGAKSLKFLSLDGLYQALGYDERDNDNPQFTDHYFTGEYPVRPLDYLNDESLKKLSFLSLASNN